jgi:predicted AlkP superfamily pyrophosphatase or phosphodiesterase
MNGPASILAAALVGCAATPPPRGGAGADGDPTAAPARRALLIGIDGLRPDALLAADTPNIDALVARGRGTLTARTQRTGVIQSAPGWVSIATGVEADRHGVLENDAYGPRDGSWPTFLGLAHDAGLRTASAAHWPDILVKVHEPADIDDARLRDDAGVGVAAAELVAGDGVDVVFLHFDDVDHAGHATGFSADNPDYTGAIAGVDGSLGPVLEAVEASPSAWLVVLTSDHGGHETSHGDDIPEDTTVPFVVAVPGGVPGALGEGVTHMDAHPTIAAWLDLPARPDLDGRSRL